VAEIGVLALQGDFHAHSLEFSGDVHNVGMEGFGGAVEELDELEDAVFVLERLALARLLVEERDPHAAIQKRQFANPPAQNII